MGICVGDFHEDTDSGVFVCVCVLALQYYIYLLCDNGF